MITRLALGLLFGVLALSPGLALAQEGAHSLEQVVVEEVDTPEGHAALAEHYRAKAEEARAATRFHERMVRAYGGSKRQPMRRHCENIAQKYSDVAKEYDALAKLHEEDAKTGE